MKDFKGSHAYTEQNKQNLNCRFTGFQQKMNKFEQKPLQAYMPMLKVKKMETI